MLENHEPNDHEEERLALKSVRSVSTPFVIIAGFGFLLAFIILVVAVDSPRIYAKESTDPTVSEENTVSGEDAAEKREALQGHWAENALNTVATWGGIHESAWEKLDPEREITRAEFIYMLLKAKGVAPVKATLGQHFSDVPTDAWYAAYVETAYQMGIANGTDHNGQTVFMPEQSVTRQEMATFLVRAVGEQGQLESWYQSGFAYAVEREWIQGYSDRTLKPNRPTKIGEAASLIRTVFAPQRKSQKTKTVDGVPVRYTQEMTVETTAYNQDEPGLSNRTATGMYVRKGVVAVDPNLISFGTHLYIEGYGYAVAADKGSAVKQQHIDVYVPTLQEALQHGRQHDVRAFILD